MPKKESKLEFKARILKPVKPGPDFEAFAILPKDISEALPRRGRTSVDITLNKFNFRVTLEPDGKLGHWLKITGDNFEKSNLELNELAYFSLSPVAEEPEPDIPRDLEDALQKSADAFHTWQATTPIAKVDWIHWIESAKQSKTRIKRIADACDMLGSGKKRVCCFDNSGFYSKALKAPKAAD